MRSGRNLPKHAPKRGAVCGGFVAKRCAVWGGLGAFGADSPLFGGAVLKKTPTNPTHQRLHPPCSQPPKAHAKGHHQLSWRPCGTPATSWWGQPQTAPNLWGTTPNTTKRFGVFCAIRGKRGCFWGACLATFGARVGHVFGKV